MFRSETVRIFIIVHFIKTERKKQIGRNIQKEVISVLLGLAHPTVHGRS
jgi:hypothetical protein